MLPKKFVAEVRRIVGALVANTLGRTALTASELTVMSPILTLGAVWLLATGSFFWAGCLILFASSFDVLDGALARAKNEVSQIGAFLDSTLDRYSEMLIFLGLLLYYQNISPASNDSTLIFFTMTGSLMTSYMRARAESLGFDCKIGLLERPERILMVVFGLLTGWMHIVLWALAILTHVTAIQRFVYVWWQSRAKSEQKRTLPLT